LYLVILAFLLSTCTAAGAAADPLSGEWLADAVHAAQRPVGLRITTLRIEADGVRIVIAERGTGPGGAPYSFKLTADCDGRVNGIVGSDETDAAQCWRSDSRTFTLKLLREASPREWRSAELAKNGKTLRVTSTVTDASGKEEKSVAVFVKQ